MTMIKEISSAELKAATDAVAETLVSTTAQLKAATDLVAAKLTVPLIVGTVSTLNSTATPLGPNAVFTGVWESTLSAGILLVNSFSDVPAAANGWQVQWSIDGVNLLIAQPLSSTASGIRAVVVTVRASFYRFVYVNGPVAQTVFSMQTTFLSAGSGFSTQPLGTTGMNEDNLAPVVRAFKAVKDATTGFFHNTTGEDMGGGVYALHVASPQLSSVLASLATRALDATVAAGNSILSSILSGVGAVFTRQADGSQKTQVTNFPATQPMSAAALPLPAGASTEATLALVKAKTDNLDATLSSRATEATLTSGAQKTQVTALPALVAGAATIGKVDQGLAGATAWLADVSDRAARLLGHITADVGGALDVALSTLATKAQFPAALVGARLDVNNGAWLGSSAPTVGQKAMAASLPVSLASDQSKVPVSATSTSFRHINTNTTTVCKSGAGTLRNVVVNDPGAASSIATITDGATVIAVIKGGGSVVGTLQFGVPFTTGLTVVTSGGAVGDLTVTFD